jgi:hypothetical protein
MADVARMSRVQIGGTAFRISIVSGSIPDAKGTSP